MEQKNELVPPKVDEWYKASEGAVQLLASMQTLVGTMNGRAFQDGFPVDRTVLMKMANQRLKQAEMLVKLAGKPADK